MISKQIILLVGQSGCGKDTIANVLESLYNLKILKSFTSRPKRINEGNTHIFISPDEVEKYKNDMVAYTKFHGYEYFCTKQQLLENDVYIIDPEGVRFLKDKMKHENIEFIIVYIKVPGLIRLYRMLKRKDGFKKAISRYINDLKMFKDLEYDFTVNNKDIKISAFDVYEYFLRRKLISSEKW